MKLYDVWVISEKSRRWERYTVQPFTSKASAKRWAATYIPQANYEVRLRDPRPSEEGAG